MTMSKRKGLICFLLVISSSPLISANVVALPTSENRFLTVETVIPYGITRFEPSVEIDLGGATASVAATPEDTLRAFLSSLMSGNKEINDSLWTKDSRQKLQELDVQRNRSGDYWPKVWKATFSNTKFFLR